MRTNFKVMLLVLVGISALASQSAVAQTAPPSKASGTAKPKPAAPKPAATAKTALSLPDTLRAAEDALGMLRSVNRVDAINTMEFTGVGTAGDGTKLKYHVALAYNPPAMRVEEIRTNLKGAKKRDIKVSNEIASWDETEIGAGLDDSVKGTVNPNMSAHDERMLQLWILPYGALKAAVAAGDKAQMSRADGATVITFPLGGQLAGITEQVTLGAKNLVTKVETKSADPARGNLVTESNYAEYADLGEIETDVMFPKHVTRRQGGKLLFDIRMTNVDPNNPYLVFPTPVIVLQAPSH